MSNELAKIGATIEVIGEFARQLFGPSAEQVGQIGGDWARLWRMKNLLCIKKKVDRLIEDKGVDVDDVHHLSLSVGLPMLEKASYQDDSFIQDRWANLIASSLLAAELVEDDFSLDVTYVEILGQLSRLDCEILEYVSEEGIESMKEGKYDVRELDPDDIRERFSGRLASVSLEKLSVLGAIQLPFMIPLRAGTGPSGFRQVVAPTLIGLNLYTAASGKPPKWFVSQSP